MPNNVIETNIMIVANGGKSEQATPECQLICIEFLENLHQNQMGLIILDNDFQFTTEYQKHLDFSGEPGQGDAFFKWLWDNQYNEDYCIQVEIHSTGEEGYLFEEIPQLPELEGFDPSDQKFLAVAIAAPKPVVIHNAVDSDWQQIYKLQEQLDIEINELCPDCLKALR